MTAPAVVDLDSLESWSARMDGTADMSGSVLLRRDGTTIGALTFSPAVLEGNVIPSAAAEHAAGPGDLREGTKVVATTMRLSGPARDLLRQSFGPDWIILDFHDAPDTADIVLTSPHSPQLTHRWTLLFPHAQIIVTEMLDPQFGLDISGPVGRLLDAGAHAYLPPSPLDQIAERVQMHLARSANGALGSSPPPTHQ